MESLNLGRGGCEGWLELVDHFWELINTQCMELKRIAAWQLIPETPLILQEGYDLRQVRGGSLGTWLLNM
jgi:hypothetical protein